AIRWPRSSTGSRPRSSNKGSQGYQNKNAPARQGRFSLRTTVRGGGHLLLEDTDTLELLLEARDAAATIHDLLGAAGPGRVRFGVDVEVQLVAGLAPGGTGL